ncbi:MAG: hypothetical protein CVU97_01460 [Firmicutes bacterium HGW-Firmicutes-21]|nr:MAG: hypothetical protein CVU97_01460 [Firmicutes bacterium HGW-Firmicutes-21]
MELPMRALLLNGDDGSIELIICTIFMDGTGFEGGYDVWGLINIKANSYSVNKSEYYFTTGALYRFYKQLERCYKEIKGIACYETIDNDFLLKAEFQKNGHVTLSGHYIQHFHVNI